jgi:integrase
VEWNLGTRPGEKKLLSLKWEHVNFDRGFVAVYATKTKEWREIPNIDEFKQKLLARKTVAKTDHLIEYRRRPVKKVLRSFRTACRRAQIPYDCITHDVRHLFATTLLSSGADLAAVSKLLGYASIKMTADVYCGVIEDEKTRAIGLLPSLSDKGDVIQLMLASGG